MADMDTASKRYSILGIDLPFPRLFPIPDGTISATDRQWFIGKYSGIPFETPVVSTLVPRLMLLGVG